MSKGLETVWNFISAQTVAYECLEACRNTLIEHMKIIDNYDNLNRKDRNKLDKKYIEMQKEFIFFRQRAKRLTHAFGSEYGELRKETDIRVDKIYNALNN